MKAEIKIKNKGKKHSIFIISMAFCYLLFYASLSYAHKVYLFAWTEGDRIYTESYLSGDKKIQDGIIKVFDSEGNELLNGKTDENGEFSFKIPEITDLRIVLEASMGHGAEYLFKKSEFSPAKTLSSVEKENERLEEPSPEFEPEDDDHLRKMINETLDEKLKPIMKEMAKLREDKGPGITEVIGGLGYILGIMGIIAFMRSRKK